MINESLLEEKLAVLEKARPWSPRTMAKMEALLRGADEKALFRVNPVKFSAEKNIPESETTDMFVHAARQGLFGMDWHLICPFCSAVVKSFKMLRHIQSDYYCAMCDIRQETSLDDYLEVAFTVTPQVREIRYHHPENLSPEEFFLDCVFSPLALVGPNVRFVDLVKPCIRLAGFVEPGQEAAFRVEAGPGVLHAYDHLNSATFDVPVSGDPVSVVQTLRADFRNDAYETLPASVRPGPVVLTVRNEGLRRVTMMLFNLPPNKPKSPANRYEPFLTAKRLLTNQTFRNLYGGELVVGSESLKVKDLTFLFTDLKGSTALYDRIGDLKAFSLVQEHFHALENIVAEKGGAIVKTIGDAVMAAFGRPQDALLAGLRMLEEVESLNRARGSRDIVLKIGLHKGPAIAVTLNERLDYFGQTVNIAARVQTLAEADEICFTEDVWRASEVKDLLKGAPAKQEAAMLKGLQEKVPVYRLRDRSSTTE